MKKKAEEHEALLDQLRGNPSLWKALLEGMPAGILLMDNDSVVRDVNQAILEWLGKTKPEIVGEKCHEIMFGSEDPCKTTTAGCPAMATFTEKVPSGPSEFGRQTSEGGFQYLQIQTFPILDDAGELLYALDFVRDVTAEKLLHAFQEEATIRDPLTRLYNRKAFHIFLDRECKRSQRQGHPLSLCLVDIDAFKDYNERKGEDAGDRCLDLVGEILLGAIRKEVDLAFRLGGDTFSLILPEASLDTATKVAQRIRDMEKANALPVQFSMASCQAEPDEGADALFHRAEELLYKAKKSGGNQNL